MPPVRSLPLLAFLIAGAAWPSGAAAQVKTCAVGTTARFVLKYDGTEWKTTAPAQARITDKDRVDVCVEHFNFLRYTLKFDVDEEQSEAYAYLTKLWGSILLDPFGSVMAAFGPTAPPAATRPPVVVKLHELYKASRALDAAVSTSAVKYTETGLTAGEATALDGERTGVSALLAAARAAYKAVDDVILGDVASFESVHGQHKELYRATIDHFRGVEGRADVYLHLSLKSIRFEVKTIGKKKPGTKVTFTLTAVDQSGSSTPIDEVDYFVQTTMPLVAHGGLSFSGLRDVSFSKVRRATSFGEEDLFQQQSSDDTSTGFALFLGWQFYGNATRSEDQRQSRVGAAFSLGTDVNAPGKRVFAGPSLLLFNRLVISGGAVFGKEAEGEAAAETLEPNLFRIIREQPKAKWFVAVSTKVF